MGQSTAPIAVLIVEDEALIRRLIADCLSESGFDVHEAESGDEALDYLRSGAAVDVLFTDIELPGAINGVKLAERACEMHPGLSVVYASGGVRPSDIRAQVPSSRFMAKPYDPAEVCTLLANLGMSGRAHSHAAT